MEQNRELRNKPIHIESINLRHQSVINVLVRQKFISFLEYILYISCICMYTKAFTLCLINTWEDIQKKKRWRNWKTLTKWNGSTEYEIEKVKQTG